MGFEKVTVLNSTGRADIADGEIIGQVRTWERPMRLARRPSTQRNSVAPMFDASCQQVSEKFMTTQLGHLQQNQALIRLIVKFRLNAARPGAAGQRGDAASGFCHSAWKSYANLLERAHVDTTRRQSAPLPRQQ
jgi:hypothetical protein